MAIHDIINAPMMLHTLNFDVLLEIMKYLKLKDIIKLSKVNKAMFMVTTNKYVLQMFKTQIIDRFMSMDCYVVDIEQFTSRLRIFNNDKLTNAVQHNDFFGGYKKLVKLMNGVNKVCRSFVMLKYIMLTTKPMVIDCESFMRNTMTMLLNDHDDENNYLHVEYIREQTKPITIKCTNNHNHENNDTPTTNIPKRKIIHYKNNNKPTKFRNNFRHKITKRINQPRKN